MKIKYIIKLSYYDFATDNIIHKIVNIKDNKYNGKYALYYGDGHLETYSNYVNGILDGTCIEYNEDRSVYKYYVYKNNEIIKEVYCEAYCENEIFDNN